MAHMIQAPCLCCRDSQCQDGCDCKQAYMVLHDVCTRCEGDRVLYEVDAFNPPSCPDCAGTGKKVLAYTESVRWMLTAGVTIGLTIGLTSLSIILNKLY